MCSHTTVEFGVLSGEHGIEGSPQGGGLAPRSGPWVASGQGADSEFPLSADDRICSPPFMELTSLCGDDTVRLLEKNGLTFPFSV